MSQLLKKYALLTACAALALCFATRPAQAQMADPGGTGEHLLFAYWTTDNYTNTNVNIHAPLGVTQDVLVANTVVYVRVRSTSANTAANTVASFNICLNPGDSWTATLSMDGLMVMDPGECDGILRELSSNPSNMNVPTPTMDGDPVDLGDTTSGFIEAWLRPRNALEDDSRGPDPDFEPQNGQMNNISGTAMLVSPMSGFSSSYNAVALTGCDILPDDLIWDVPGTANTLGPQLSLGADGAAGGTGVNMDDMDGDGCWTTVMDDPTDAPDEATDPAGTRTNPAMNGILYALQGMTDSDSDTMYDRDLLTGRWTAISDDNVMSHTKVILTFPTNHLNYANGTSDPVSVYIFDDMGDMVHTSAGLTLNMGVNMCTFMPMDMMTMFSCNDEEGDSFDAMSGEFRIFNNLAPASSARTKEYPGLTELALTPPVNPQVPDASLGAIGLIFSYFEGTDGMEYDQVTSIQMIDVDRDGNDDEVTPADSDSDPSTPSSDDTDGNFDTGLDMF